MNISKIIKSTSILFLLIFIYACSPIEDRDELKNSFSADNIVLEATQSTPGGNKVSIKMATKGVTGYWDYVLEKKVFTDQVDDIVYPFRGEVPLTFYVTTPYLSDGSNVGQVEYVKKTIKVKITQLDTKLHDYFYALVGKNMEGKNWVFNRDASVWYAMTAPESSGSMWWDKGRCCPAFGEDAYMAFDVENAALNFRTYSSKDDKNPKKGEFSFSKDFKKFSISGEANLLGSDDPDAGSHREYQIIKLTDNELILYVPVVYKNVPGKDEFGWIWVFKPQENK